MTRTILVALALATAASAGAQSIDGVLFEPRQPAYDSPVRFTVVGTQYPDCPFVWQTPERDPTLDSLIHLRGEEGSCSSTLPLKEFRKTFLLDPLPLGTYFLQVEVNDFPASPSNRRELFRVGYPDPRVFLSKLETTWFDGFWVFVEWSNPRDGSHGFGHGTVIAKDSAAFWFFSPDNLEVTVKVLDGRPVNDHWWVFIANMTDLEIKVTVAQTWNWCPEEDPNPCQSKTYVQTAGKSRNFIDVNAFTDRKEP